MNKKLCSLFAILGLIVVLSVLFGIKQVFFAIVTVIGFVFFFLVIVIAIFSYFPRDYDEDDR